MRHLLSAESISEDTFNEIYDLSLSLKGLLRSGRKKFSALRGKSVLNLFYEPSTRTRTSFEMAGKLLSADVINISTSFSSVKKGETLLDTVRTIDMMHPDAVVLRHPCEGSCDLVSSMVDAAIINGGDGCHEHPSQALIDAVTVREFRGKVEGLKVVIIGDVSHSRVARSDAILFRKLGAEVFIYGPSTMMPRFPQALGVKVLSSFDDVVDVADVVILLRIQLERQSARKVFPSLREYAELYGLNGKRVSQFGEDVLILHPGPVNRGVELNDEVMKWKGTLIFYQVENGLSVRMVLLSMVTGRIDRLKEEIDA